MHRLLPLVLVLTSSGCAFTALRPVGHVEDPTRPVLCNGDDFPVLYDVGVAGLSALVAYRLFLDDLADCASDRGCNATFLVPTALGVGHALSAAHGSGLPDACRAARRLQRACAKGDLQSCHALAPAWQPPAPAPPAQARPSVPVLPVAFPPGVGAR